MQREFRYAQADRRDLADRFGDLALTYPVHLRAQRGECGGRLAEQTGVLGQVDADLRGVGTEWVADVYLSGGDGGSPVWGSGWGAGSTLWSGRSGGGPGPQVINGEVQPDL